MKLKSGKQKRRPSKLKFLSKVKIADSQSKANQSKASAQAQSNRAKEGKANTNQSKATKHVHKQSMSSQAKNLVKPKQSNASKQSSHQIRRSAI